MLDAKRKGGAFDKATCRAVAFSNAPPAVLIESVYPNSNHFN